MELLRFLFRSAPRAVGFAILAGIISGGCSALLLGIISLTLSNSESASSNVIWLFAGLCVVVPVTRFVSESMLMRIGQGAVFEQRLKLSRRILDAPLRQLEQIGAHRLMAALTDDVSSIAMAVLMIPLATINSAVVLGCLIYLGWLSWGTLMVVLAFMAVGIFTYQLPLLKAMQWLRRARESEDAVFRDLRALTEGNKELKLHRRRRAAFLDESLAGHAARYRDQNVFGQSIYIAASSWGQILFFIVIGLILFMMPQFKPTTPQELTGYVIVLFYMMTPLQVALNGVPALGRAAVALKKINDLGLSLEAEPAARAGAAAPAASWRRLELRGVTHTYRREGEDGEFKVGPLDFALHPGEVVFIIGGNGSGKTTFAKLLLGLYAPEEGSLRLDGTDITDEGRDDYRQLFSAVYSDFYLFERLLGLESDELAAAAREYLSLLKLDNKVEVRDGALSTTELSQGQRKRLALLTAYLEDRPVYLFDEWAADQDPFFKEVFYHQLLPGLKARGKTVVVISHDDRYYHVADRIVKLEEGRITPAPEDFLDADGRHELAAAALLPARPEAPYAGGRIEPEPVPARPEN
ncbi:MAG: cyclic peptide export ABC transporter [Acidobacteria bacterium]|nr:cyclic peptide export ABC transporter [Acidobacteriota bacterium]